MGLKVSTDDRFHQLFSALWYLSFLMTRKHKKHGEDKVKSIQSGTETCRHDSMLETFSMKENVIKLIYSKHNTAENSVGFSKDANKQHYYQTGLY